MIATVNFCQKKKEILSFLGPLRFNFKAFLNLSTSKNDFMMHANFINMKSKICLLSQQELCAKTLGMNITQVQQQHIINEVPGLFQQKRNLLANETDHSEANCQQNCPSHFPV